MAEFSSYSSCSWYLLAIHVVLPDLAMSISNPKLGPPATRQAASQLPAICYQVDQLLCWVL